ncbi:MAG TPA: penicillin-binding protein 1A [Stellaceae bacterium]|jgi:penicillin-binding protein 1A|nr:penicillin-binding protein 1A [Stellaceae bacterium]
MKLVKILIVLVILAGLAGAGMAGLAVWYFGRDLPDYEQLANYQPPIVTRVYAGDGRLMAEYATEKRVFIPIKAMPPLVIHAFLAAEDKNFYTHPGVDPLSMLRAAVTDLLHYGSGRRPVGASTITQQVAKNFLLTNEVSLQRKVREALIAVRMEQALSKDRILELYLNEIYLGGGAYGVAAAALNYFNKSLDELTPEEAAFLGGLPKAPNNYSPLRYPEAARERRNYVLDRMVEAGFLTPEQGTAAEAKPIKLAHRDDTEIVKADYFTEEVRRELLQRYGEKGLYTSGLAVRTSLDPHFQAIADTALRDALIAYDRRHGWRGPVTRIDAAGDWQPKLKAIPLPAGVDEEPWQLAVVLGTSSAGADIGFADGSRGQIPFDELKWARKELPDAHVGPVPAQTSDVLTTGEVVLVQSLAPQGLRTGRNVAAFGLRQIPEVSGAFVAMDPHTGRVLALDGGFSYEMSQFDRATQAMRQTGSAIKPFVYLAALDHGFTPSTIVLDAPLVLDQGPGLPKWNPSNYERKFYGPVPLLIGLEESLNLVTARVGASIGLDAVADSVERFGILDHMPREYSFVIGAGETTPLRLATAYAMLVNGGKKITPSFIDRVQDRDGVTIFRADTRACDGCINVAWNGQPAPDLPDNRAQIADPRSTYQIVSMMEGVIQRGTGRSVSVIGKPLAGKTGTTNDSNDTWFMGFSPDLVAGVFIGFDQPHSLGQRETGATVAAPAFRDFMQEALKDQPATPFRIPPGIELVRINPTTGQLARPDDKNAILEAYKPGTEPNAAGAGVVVSGNVPSAGLGLDGGGGGDTDGADSPQPVPASGTGGLY